MSHLTSLISKIFVQYGCSGPDQGRIVYCNLPVLLVRNHTSCLAGLAFLFQPSNKNKVGGVSGEYIISCNLGLVRIHKVFHTNLKEYHSQAGSTTVFQEYIISCNLELGYTKCFTPIVTAIPRKDLIVGINFPKAAIEVWFPCLTWQP